MRTERGFWLHNLTFVRSEIQGDFLLVSMTGTERYRSLLETLELFLVSLLTVILSFKEQSDNFKTLGYPLSKRSMKSSQDWTDTGGARVWVHETSKTLTTRSLVSAGFICVHAERPRGSWIDDGSSSSVHQQILLSQSISFGSVNWSPPPGNVCKV